MLSFHAFLSRRVLHSVVICVSLCIIRASIQTNALRGDVMFEFFRRLLDPTGFPARWYCGQWSAGLGWLHILSDVTIWLCYMLIPVLFLVFIRRRRDIKLPAVSWLFAGFIFFCGMVHLVESVIFWFPVYRLFGLLKACTAGVSVLTVGSLVPVIPRLLAAGELELHNEQLSEKLRLLEELTAEVSQLNIRLESKNTELERTNRELDSFVYIASHDLQEPLRTLVSYSTLLEGDVGDDLSEDVKEDLHFIKDAARNMQSLIEALLKYSRMGRATLSPKMVNMNLLVQQVLGFLEHQIARTGAEFEVQTLPTLNADPVLLRQLLQNLLSNAMKFCKTKPLVKIEVEEYEADWQFSIVDNGIGIDPKFFGKLFRPFRRLHGRAAYEGHGIGLAECKKVVELHGGTIWIESSPDEGSCFCFTLPRKLPQELY